MTTTLNINQIDVDVEETLSFVEFENDDLTGKILNTRQNSDLTPYQQFQKREELRKKQEGEEKTVLQKSFDVTKNVVSDVSRGVIEAPLQAVGGFADAVNETFELFVDKNDVAGSRKYIGKGRTASERGIYDPERKEYYVISEGYSEPTQLIRDPKTVTGQGVRSITQFLTGFIPAGKLLKGVGVVGNIKRSAGAGAIADAAVFDAHEARLSDMMQEVPALENPISEYLASDPNDTEAQGKFKNAVEGLIIGTAIEPLVQGVKLVKAYKKQKQEIKNAKEPKEKIDVELENQEFIPLQDIANEKSIAIEIPEYKTGAKKAPKKAAKNINLSKLDTTEDIKSLINTVAEADAVNINEARRQIIRNKDLPELADDLGMTVEDLLQRKKGEAFNAEQILASRKILDASGKNVINFAKEAMQNKGSEEALALFKRAIAQHQAIQSQVSGLTAEAGRALNSFNVMAKSSKEQERLISEALAASGGADMAQEMARMISVIDPKKLNKFVDKARKATSKDMLFEAWINQGLLSNPQTHMVNITSNAFVATMQPLERKLASYLGDEIPSGEANAQLRGMIEGIKDGMRMGWQTLKTGETTDPLQKIEVSNQRSISAETFEASGAVGQGIDFIGNATRLPGRFLLAEDAFFKAVGYRMELHAQAYRQAYQEGLDGEAAGKRILEIIENPPENIKYKAVDASRYQTFTNQLTGTARLAEKIRNKSIFRRVVVPFLRTPTNIFFYSLERTPLARYTKSYKEAIKEGGAEAQLARSRMMAGSMIMAAMADLAMNGHITGAGPINNDMKKFQREAGKWQPYSIKIGDTYYAYNRLDPVGALLGLSADITEIMGQADEFSVGQLATASAASVGQNMISKTYVRNLTEFFELFATASDNQEVNERKFKRYFERLGGTIVPAGVAGLAREIDPTLRAQDDIFDEDSTYNFLNGLISNIKSRTPGYSDDLPPRRNVFGEPIVLQGGVGPDILSPIYISKESDEPIVREIIRNQVPLQNVRKTIQVSVGLPNAVYIELNADQYDRYILLAAGKGLRDARGVSLKQALTRKINSSQYLKLTPGPRGGRADQIQEVWRDYRSMAKAQLLEEYPDLQAKIYAESKKQKRELGL